jgi:hypothetical protein
VKFVINAPAVTEGNILIPFRFYELFGAFQRIRVDESPYVMFLVEKISDFEFPHRSLLLPLVNRLPLLDEGYSFIIANSVTWKETVSRRIPN